MESVLRKTVNNLTKISNFDIQLRSEKALKIKCNRRKLRTFMKLVYSKLDFLYRSLFEKKQKRKKKHCA